MRRLIEPPARAGGNAALGQHCDIVDLDGSALLAADRDAVIYRNGQIDCPPSVWEGELSRADA